MRNRIKKNKANSAYYHRHREKILEGLRNKPLSLKKKFNCGKSNAISRGHTWELTIEDYANLIKNNKCHYCSGVLSSHGVGLDRIDCKIGYTIDNVVPCCKGCNITRNRYISPSEMLEIVKLLKAIRNREDIWYNCDYANKKER